jgi:hypothetical protein
MEHPLSEQAAAGVRRVADLVDAEGRQRQHPGERGEQPLRRPVPAARQGTRAERHMHRRHEQRQRQVHGHRSAAEAQRRGR